jgi:hypothetical protein
MYITVMKNNFRLCKTDCIDKKKASFINLSTCLWSKTCFIHVIRFLITSPHCLVMLCRKKLAPNKNCVFRAKLLTWFVPMKNKHEGVYCLLQTTATSILISVVGLLFLVKHVENPDDNVPGISLGSVQLSCRWYVLRKCSEKHLPVCSFQQK